MPYPFFTNHAPFFFFLFSLHRHAFFFPFLVVFLDMWFFFSGKRFNLDGLDGVFFFFFFLPDIPTFFGW